MAAWARKVGSRSSRRFQCIEVAKTSRQAGWSRTVRLIETQVLWPTGNPNLKSACSCSIATGATGSRASWIRLRSEGYRRKRVYLLDNASEDDSVRLTRANYPEVTILRFPENFGYCMANNVGMQAAWEDGCEWAVWQNNDTRVLPGWLEEMVRAGSSDPKIGVVGPAFYAWDRDEPNQYMMSANPAAVPGMLGKDSEPVDVEFVEGSSFMVRRCCVEDVGWLDPWLFFYFEETDFCCRARHRGWRIVIAPRSLARHYAGGWSAGSAGNASRASWLKLRNMYIGQLARPDRSWARNLWEFCHLELICQKESWLRRRSPRDACLNMGVALWVLAHGPRAYRKWHAARRGEKLAPLLPGFERVLKRKPLEILGGATATRQPQGSTSQIGDDPSVIPRSAASVVIPTRNRVETLQACLHALAGQAGALPDLEVVVCDDGSTEEVTAAWSGLDAAGLRVKFVAQEPRAGGGPEPWREEQPCARGDFCRQ